MVILLYNAYDKYFGDKNVVEYLTLRHTLSSCLSYGRTVVLSGSYQVENLDGKREPGGDVPLRGVIAATVYAGQASMCTDARRVFLLCRTRPAQIIYDALAYFMG